MAQSVVDNSSGVVTGEANELFDRLFGKYVHKDGDRLVILVDTEDLSNLGQIVLQGVFGFFLHLEMQRGGHASVAAFAASQNNSES